ncbi:ADP-ribosylglycohydrolase family protein [Streptomyces sp. NPDC002265]|uniref:ADP-ribosylglycohydrolase family protein n=1 Tax=Streptomyces sp. NPDC002265 TaxID=3154415 RepID=UPI00332C6DE3
MPSTACIPPVPAPGDAAELRDRARGALLGLAVGDALGAPAENMRPSEIRARWGRIKGYVAEKPAGTDDTEYAIFSGLLLARHGCALTPAHVEAAWHEWIADRAEGPFRGAGFSERGTLENLRRGLAAPISAQHRHAWSDGLAMRAAPFGVFAAGRPAEAARLVAIDGSVSHEGEGIYGGQAVAAGVAAAMAGARPTTVVAAALAVVPDDSWTARSLRRAVTVAHRGERAVRSAVVIGGYPWTDLAPEAVALAFGAYAAADGDFRDAVLTAVNMGRDADTTAAVAGALAGATQGEGAIPAEWAAAIGPARGSCLPSMAGHHVLDVAELLTPDENGKWDTAGPAPAPAHHSAPARTPEPAGRPGPARTPEPAGRLEPAGRPGPGAGPGAGAASRSMPTREPEPTGRPEPARRPDPAPRAKPAGRPGPGPEPEPARRRTDPAGHPAPAGRSGSGWRPEPVRTPEPVRRPERVRPRLRRTSEPGRPLPAAAPGAPTASGTRTPAASADTPQVRS